MNVTRQAISSFYIPGSSPQFEVFEVADTGVINPEGMNDDQNLLAVMIYQGAGSVCSTVENSTQLLLIPDIGLLTRVLPFYTGLR